MNKKDAEKQLREIERGTEEIIPLESLKKDILEGKKLKVKFGVDPTAPELHLGHTVVMEKLRTFQKYGHEIILIIGDFTAMIGDPSGRTIQRPVLSEKDIKANVKSFTNQISKILSRENLKIVHNSAWLKKLGTEGVIKLASLYTVAQMLERNDFSERYSSGNAISIMEFIYPLLQGYDSYEVESDLEIGGTDQKFNLLVGREIQKNMGQSQQSILTMPLLEGTDGVRKMSKSYGNHIGINENPQDIFGKIMSVSDEMMLKYYQLLTLENIETVKQMHPMEAKKALAHFIVEKYHGSEAASKAREGFSRVFSEGKIPDEMKQYRLKSREKIVDIMSETGLAPSKKAAKRLIEQGGVEFSGERITDTKHSLEPGADGVLKVGKRGFLKLL